jgi:RNA-directed DNA polymerase
MTASGNIGVDAAFTRPTDWLSIDWKACRHEVRKLQMRIAKAVREGHWRKVKALQWLLTHSFSAEALAVRRVTENQGKNTPGVDGVTWATPQEKSAAIDSLRRAGYQPKPLRRIYIPKSNGRKRPLSIPVKKCMAMQALYKLALEPVAETLADRDSYGFRPERCTTDAIEQLFNVLAQKNSAQWILEGDIRSCFDKISHEWMVNNICTDVSILKKWLKAGYIEEGKLFPTTEGAPQGGIASPTLSNLVLDGLERILDAFRKAEKVNAKDRRQNKYQVYFVRYADDFVVTGNSKEVLETQIKPLIRVFLAERGLELSDEKTRITHISEGFDFLGQTIRKYNVGTPKEKLLIKPAKKNVKAFLKVIRETIYLHRTAKQETVIARLNPKITGWANYHRHVVAKDTFFKVDHAIWRALWCWARRRHPNKSRRWIYARYFEKIDTWNGVFSCKVRQKDGTETVLSLKRAADIPIKRHIKIRAKAIPFDPLYEEYFEQRDTKKMEDHLAGRRKILTLWKRQGGQCSVCTERITETTGWHVHHLIPRVEGGPDTASNLCLLHPVCHRQGHSFGFRFVLPVGHESLT